MKLPPDTIIAPEKITKYLLVPQARSDKSGFLRKAGFDAAQPMALHAALRALRAEVEVEPADENLFGRYLIGDGIMVGPGGRKLRVRSVWMTEHLSGATKFVTLIPLEILPP